MKVIHVVKTLSEVYGGPARSVQGLVSALESKGVEAWVVSLEDGGAPWIKGISNYRCFGLKGVKGVRRKMEELIDEVKPDIIQTHDLWMPKLHACCVAARRKGVPYIITPRGSLEKWSLRQKWWKKYPALWTYQGYDMRHALAIHTTAESEASQAKKFCGKIPVYINTNGLSFPDSIPAINKDESRKRKALFISRIHKKKGLLTLVEAWDKVRPKGWFFEVVGTDADGYQKIVQDEVVRRGLTSDFVFSGPVNDKDKWQKYASADMFVLPTHSENFGIVIAEALYAGLPVITTKGAPWEDIAKSQAGWWIDDDVDALTTALIEATSKSDDEMYEMGKRGHKLVVEKYSWEGIVKDLIKKYKSLLFKC